MPTLAEIRAERARRNTERERERLARDIEHIRARCTSLAGFVREAWAVLEPSNPYIHGWHIDAICLHLEAITNGTFLALGLENRLLINVPPGTMKSLIVSVFWPAWEWGPRALPSMRYLTTSYSENYVKRDSRRMRDLVQSEWYRALWPEVALVRAGEASFANDKTGFREGVPFGSLTAGRGDRVVIDDPHSTETAESEAERGRTTRIFRESVPSRLIDPIRSAIVVIMQRLHANDVSGVIEKLKIGYIHLRLPMEFEADHRCVTPIFEDPRTFDGELLFPERFPRAVVERDKIPLGPYAVAGQFQQRPSPREGGLFKRASFEVVDALPPVTKTVRAWDFAGTKKKGSGDPDWTVGLRMSRGSDGLFYIDKLDRFREGPGEVRTRLKNTASQDGPFVSIRLPQDPGQAGKAQAESMIGDLAGHIVKALPVTGDKETRAKPLASQVAVGNVRLLRGDWNETFLAEIEMFPSGAHDDQVDAAADAFNELAGVGTTGFLELYKSLAEERAAKAAKDNAPAEPAPAVSGFLPPN